MRRNKVCESLDLECPNTSYSDILQRLVRRYLFKLERQKDEGIVICIFFRCGITLIYDKKKNVILHTQRQESINSSAEIICLLVSLIDTNN